MTDDGWRRIWQTAAGIFGAAAVAIGAYGAHGLGGHAQDLTGKASEFGLLHALALLALSRGAAPLRRSLKLAGTFFLLGTLLFCGALTALALTSWPVALVTPFGGTSFILGWLCLAGGGMTQRKTVL
ncbi:hypothetical protein GALL_266410 [mine drainage metagenome]|uniref:Membrane protein containing DUF423 n=1 Tax=mine drainage metagenome TaxID=410659 RepID=A0A1J5RH50_9ZZZZ